MTQREVILNHLQTHPSITSLEDINKYGVTRLAAVISQLRERGYSILSINKTVKTRYGYSTHISEYRLVGGSNE